MTLSPDLSCPCLRLLTFSLKVKNERFVLDWKRKTARNTVSVSLSWTRHRVTALCYSTPTDPEKGGKRRSVKLPKKKKPSIITCFSSRRPSRSLHNDLCVSGQARFHSSPAQYFISVLKKKRKRNVCKRRRETDQSV